MGDGDLKDFRAKLDSVFKVRKPYKVGLRLDEDDFKEFQKLCEPYSASHVIAMWIHEQVAKAREEKRGKR